LIDVLNNFLDQKMSWRPSLSVVAAFGNLLIGSLAGSYMSTCCHHFWLINI